MDLTKIRRGPRELGDLNAEVDPRSQATRPFSVVLVPGSGWLWAHSSNFDRPLKWLALAHLARNISDSYLRKALTPSYAMGCKRILLSNDYYKALARENVQLITDDISEIGDHGIITKDRRKRSFDVIIFGTGSRGADLLSPLRVLGRNGVVLSDVWVDGAEAFLGMTVAGFPDFFMLVGPNTFLAHNSVVFMIEAQVNYVAQCRTFRSQFRRSAL